MPEDCYRSERRKGDKSSVTTVGLFDLRTDLDEILMS